MIQFRALVLTIISEAVVAWLLLHLFRTDTGKYKTTGFIIILNAITHTLFWYIFPCFNTAGVTSLYIAESLIIIIESITISGARKIKIIHASIISILANTCSMVSGMLIL